MIALTKSIHRPKLHTLSIAVAASFAASPVFADSEIDALKAELAAQRQMIQQLLANQETQAKLVTGIIAVPPIDQKPTAPSVQGTEQKSAPSSPSVSVYGVVDLNVASMDSGFGQKMSVGSGGLTASRIGVKGEKPFGEGLKAIGLAEIGLLLDTGSAGNGTVAPGINNTSASSGGQLGTGSQLFSRQVWAGILSDKWGSLTAGRQYSGSFGAAANFNAMGTGLYGYSASFLAVAGMPTRVNNSLVYFTPIIDRMIGQLTYTTGLENNVDRGTATTAGATTKTSDKAGRGLDLSVTYCWGNFSAAVTGWSLYNNTYAANETALARKTGEQVAVSYDLGFAKLFASGVKGRISGGGYQSVTKSLSSSSGWSISASAPFGASKVYVSYTGFNDKSALDRDASMLGVGYTYLFAPNTNLYASWGRVSNNRNASYSLADGGNLVGNVGVPGFRPSATMAGVNYSF